MKSAKINISIGILLFINFIFCYKYTSRYTSYSLYLSLALLFFQLLAYCYGDRILISHKFKNIICYGLISFILGLVVISHFKIPLESLNVDRWSVISSFLTELYAGNYPYYALSHMGNYPGPMPIYFLIAAPFQFLGELSVLSCLGYCTILAFFIRKKVSTTELKFLIVHLFTAMYLIWEITTRSNIFTFTMLVLIVLHNVLDLKNKTKTGFYILAVLVGLLLSTRSVYILPYIVFFLSALINREITFKKLFLFLMVSVIAFISTFLPLIYFYGDDFFNMNPFIIQSSFLVPTFYTFIFILISIGCTFLAKTKLDNYFYSGLSLFTAILIYFFYHLINFGYETAFINSKIDISYFIFCIPFLIIYLVEQKPEVKTVHKAEN